MKTTARLMWAPGESEFDTPVLLYSFVHNLLLPGIQRSAFLLQFTQVQHPRLPSWLSAWVSNYAAIPHLSSEQGETETSSLGTWQTSQNFGNKFHSAYCFKRGNWWLGWFLLSMWHHTEEGVRQRWVKCHKISYDYECKFFFINLSFFKLFLLLFHYSCTHFPPNALPCPAHDPCPTFKPPPPLSFALCWLCSTHRWDHMVFIFYNLAHFT